MRTRYAHAQMARGGAGLQYACAFGGGGAESMTFDLKSGDKREMRNSAIRLTEVLKIIRKR